MSSLKSLRNQSATRRELGPRKLGMEAVEARQLMAADLANMVDTVGPTPTDEPIAEVATPNQEAESTTRVENDRAAISNGFLSELAQRIDVWEHAYLVGDALPGFDVSGNATDVSPNSIGSSGLDGVDLADRGNVPQQIGSSGLDGITAENVDDVFAGLESNSESESDARSRSSLPDSVLGVLRWENLMEYFEVLGKLSEIAAKYDFDFDMDNSLQRARTDSGLDGAEVITGIEALEAIDRVSSDLDESTTSDSQSESESKFQEMLQEALEEFRKRMVIYWQNVDGPGAVVYDPYNVAGDN